MANKKCGLIGTCEYHIGSNIYPSSFTTPLLETTTKFLKEMVDCNTEFAIMETSSHGLSQKRCETLNFDAAIYTNITAEHLDYHKNLQEYASAKKNLFRLLQKSTKSKKIAILSDLNRNSERIPRCLRRGASISP